MHKQDSIYISPSSIKIPEINNPRKESWIFIDIFTSERNFIDIFTSEILTSKPNRVLGKVNAICKSLSKNSSQNYTIYIFLTDLNELIILISMKKTLFSLNNNYISLFWGNNTKALVVWDLYC